MLNSLPNTEPQLADPISTPEVQPKRRRGWNGPPPPRPGPRGFRVDLTGRTSGLLTVLGFAGRNEYGHAQWKCRCQCGGISIVLGINLSKTKSCGCRCYGGNLASLARKRARPRVVSENHIAPSARLTPDDVRTIRSERAKGEGQHELARRFGVSQVAIHKIVSRKTWGHIA